jgi:peptidyl-prolyl cis-trans isomerase C
MRKRAAARHILVPDLETCERLKKEIESGADFAAVAREHSECPSSSRGGELGEMVREFDTVVFSAPLNAVQGPVKTQFGYHLIEVTHRKE